MSHTDAIMSNPSNMAKHTENNEPVPDTDIPTSQVNIELDIESNPLASFGTTQDNDVHDVVDSDTASTGSAATSAEHSSDFDDHDLTISTNSSFSVNESQHSCTKEVQEVNHPTEQSSSIDNVDEASPLEEVLQKDNNSAQPKSDIDTIIALYYDLLGKTPPNDDKNDDSDDATATTETTDEEEEQDKENNDFTWNPSDDDSEPDQPPFIIKPSKLGGLGAFATRNLYVGDIIHMESPLLKLTHATGHDAFKAFCALDDEKQEKYLSLHGYSRNGCDFEIENIKDANSFYIHGGVAIYETASRFNHACQPVRNVRYDIGRDAILTFTMRRTAKAGEELTISYGGDPMNLYQNYGFRCQCGGCVPLTDEDIEAMENAKYGRFH